MSYPIVDSDSPGDELERLFGDLSVRGALIDERGSIVAVNHRWKLFAEAASPPRPNYGIGENYLQYSAFPDQTWPRILDELIGVIAGRLDCYSFIYPCATPDAPRWCLLLALPYEHGAARAAVLHIDISSFLPSVLGRPRPGFLAETDPPSDDPQIERVIRSLEKSLMETLSQARRALRGSEPRPAAPSLNTSAKAPPPAPVFSRRQQQVLALMTRGMTNAEIARELSISPNTVKIHVSEILARLGLSSRAQAIHWALTRLPAGDSG